MESPKKLRIGDMLTQQGLLSDSQLQLALADQKNSGRKLGRTIIDLGFVEEDKLLKLLSEQLKIPFVDIKHFQFDTELVQQLPEVTARRFRSMLLANEEDGYLIGMADPMDIFAYDELQRVLKKQVYPAVVREGDLLLAFDAVYRNTEEISSLASELEDELEGAVDFDLSALGVGTDVSDAPVVRLLQSIFEDAVQTKASDIHIEPDESVLRIRQRIDGVLQEQVMKEKRAAAALVLRLKIMSGLDISEKRLPQDGRFHIRVGHRNIDVRVSTMPVAYGESVVLRLLDQTDGALDLTQLGMPEVMRKRFEMLIQRPHGMILVTGPTGSGKTTTLYSALKKLNKPGTKIITAEDPVEYRLPRVSQVQINEKVGLTFTRVLRSALRQDPDIVLIGEMRDQETVEIGLRAAMTGHLVLSTLHTNDAIKTAIRLIDMGAFPFLVATSLLAIVAQRLVRKVCDYCCDQRSPKESERVWIKMIAGKESSAFENEVYKKGRGCHRCNNTGYSGRIGVYELLELDVDLADALRANDILLFTRLAREKTDFESLAMCALRYAKLGITSMDEVFKLVVSLDDVTTGVE
ncbi:MAG: Flp pilus assembly complex ATPase component TadA [Pseudomonadales bacterium]|nr:Flp pilus assembly complex ATPase component TadA [Pseudomonadales bacterium]